MGDLSGHRRAFYGRRRFFLRLAGAAHNGKRGNPNIFPREFFPELLALTEDHGGSTVIRAHPERFLPVEVAQEQLTDVDTPQALKALREQM